MHLSVCLLVCLSVDLSLSILLSDYRTIYLSNSLPIYLSICLSRTYLLYVHMHLKHGGREAYIMSGRTLRLSTRALNRLCIMFWELV